MQQGKFGLEVKNMAKMSVVHVNLNNGAKGTDEQARSQVLRFWGGKIHF